MVLSRFRRKQVTHYEPLNELKLHPFINSIFMKLMEFELRLMRLGLNFPFGGSRMIVARKLG
jgi:hypothetical protein